MPSIDVAAAQRGLSKTARIPIKVVVAETLPRPDWIRVRPPQGEGFRRVKQLLRETGLNTVCEEASCPNVLTPDFRGRSTRALDILAADPPDVMNHNLETVPRLYRQARPGADYGHSLQLLQSFRQRCPNVPTKSGLMLGLGETHAEVLSVLHDLRLHGVQMLTVGQYLQPRPGNLAVRRYVPPAQFDALARQAQALGFVHAACGPLVRSSYHADRQAQAAGI